MSVTSRRYFWPIVLAGVALLFGWPFLFGHYLRGFPTQTVMAAWALGAALGFVILVVAYSAHLKAHGRHGAKDGRLGLAGKRPGLIIHRGFVPVLLLTMAAVVLLSPTRNTIALIAASAIALKLLYDYVLAVIEERRQAAQLRQRSEQRLDVDLALSRDRVSEATLAIEQVFSVPIERVRLGDRFGSDLGSFSYLDSRLDRLGGLLVRRCGDSQESVDLTGIVTVDQFIRAWCSPQ